jgi:hypothetical protein
MIVWNMLSHVVGELVPFERLINYMDQRRVLLEIPWLFFFVVDVKYPVRVVLELNKRLVDLPGALIFIFKILKQEVFDGGL